MHVRNGTFGAMVNGKGKPKHQFHGHFGHHMYHTNWPGVEPRPLQLVTNCLSCGIAKIFISECLSVCRRVAFKYIRFGPYSVWPQLHISNNQLQLHCIYQSIRLSSSVQRQVCGQLRAAGNKNIEQQAFRTNKISTWQSHPTASSSCDTTDSVIKQTGKHWTCHIPAFRSS